MNIIATIMLTLAACALSTSPTFRRAYAVTAGVTLGILSTLWVWKCAGLFPFK